MLARRPTRTGTTEGMLPAITLSFLPMSHVMGRGVLYSTLASGGTAYFAARSDLSTFLEDLALVRPTQLELRAAHLGHAVPGGPERGRPPRRRRRRPRRRRRAGDGRAARRACSAAAVLGDHRFRAHLAGAEGLGRGVPRHAPDRGLRLDRGRRRLRRRPDPAATGDRLQAGRRARARLLRHRPAASPRRAVGQVGRASSPATTSVPRSPPRCSTPTATTAPATSSPRLGPDQVKYLDRRNNVLKLSQGEFVTVSKLEAAFGDSPLVRQIYVYGNSARLLPAGRGRAHRGRAGQRTAATELRSSGAAPMRCRASRARRACSPTRSRATSSSRQRRSRWRTACSPASASWPGRSSRSATAPSSSSSTPTWPTARRTSCARCARAAPTGRCWRPSAGPRAHCSAPPPPTSQPDAQFTDLGGDSLSALTFANLLHEIFDVDVPVGVIVSPASDLAAIAAYVEAQRAGGAKRPTYDAVHGRDATEVHARDLTLDKFLDAATLPAAPSLPGPGPRGPHRAAHRRDRIPRPLPGPGVAGADGPGRRQGDLPGPRQADDEPRAPGWTTTFDSGDPKLLAHYRSLAAEHLEVFAGDKGEANLGLDAGDVAAAGRHRRPDRRPRRAGQPRAALQPAVRAQRARHRRADPHRAHHEASSRSSTCRRSASAPASNPGTVHRGRRHPGDQRDPQGRRQLRQRLRQQQVGAARCCCARRTTCAVCPSRCSAAT